METNVNLLTRLSRPLLLVALVSMIASVTAQPAPGVNAPIINYENRFLPVVAKNGMVASPERLAAEIGRRILERGGNAVDAAVATGFALAVSYPRAGNLAGGGFMLIHLAEENRQTLIDYRETAPSAATRDLFLNDEGEVDRMREFFSHQSAGTPGTVAGLVYAQEKYGTLPLAEVVTPAIELAEKGFEVSFALNYEINARAERLRMNPEALRLFFKPDGALYEVGETFRQPDLAWTLRQIAERGKAGFYRGEVAQRIVAEMEAGDGLITLDDLADYTVVERKPIKGTFRDYEIVSTPPPSSGGLHIIQILNLLEPYDLKGMGHNSAAYLHHLAESMKRAYADRARFLGDPDFVDIPVSALIDKAYAERLRATIKADRATPAADILPGAALPE